MSYFDKCYILLQNSWMLWQSRNNIIIKGKGKNRVSSLLYALCTLKDTEKDRNQKKC